LPHSYHDNASDYNVIGTRTKNDHKHSRQVETHTQIATFKLHCQRLNFEKAAAILAMLKNS